MGGLLGGQRVCWPPSQIIGGAPAPPPPWPPSSYAYDWITRCPVAMLLDNFQCRGRAKAHYACSRCGRRLFGQTTNQIHCLVLKNSRLGKLHVHLGPHSKWFAFAYFVALLLLLPIIILGFKTCPLTSTDNITGQI